MQKADVTERFTILFHSVRIVGEGAGGRAADYSGYCPKCDQYQPGMRPYHSNGKTKEINMFGIGEKESSDWKRRML